MRKTTQKQRRYEILHSAVVHVPGLLLMMHSIRELADFKSASINMLPAETYVTNDAPH